MHFPCVHIALPLMDELENIGLLLQNLNNQTYTHFRLYVCVNQPDDWWRSETRRAICERNIRTLHYLNENSGPNTVIIDKCSPGEGWKGKNYGIGWARKTIMDYIAGKAGSNDIILSLDADTLFSDEYLQSIMENIVLNNKVAGLSVPYYHNLTGNDSLDRAILRYEIYMRNYSINMFRIANPYCFTALGSAIALPVWAYRAVGGITPKLSGEDFYFLQKLTKYGKIVHWNNQMVFPAARLSDRVLFGTGPALIKGIGGEWESYPVYTTEQFDAVHQTSLLYAKLFRSDVSTPMDNFLVDKFGELPWLKLRSNSTSVDGFVKLCHQKIDGLRILQFLKENRPAIEISDEVALLRLLKNPSFDSYLIDYKFDTLDFNSDSIASLNCLRDILFNIENSYRRAHWMETSGLTVVYN